MRGIHGHSLVAGAVFLAGLAGAPALAAEPADATRLGSPQPVMVHLFEWRWDDIAAECEDYLGPTGIDAVQVSPPNEHIVPGGVEGAWWARYQPVSYEVTSRSGDREAFEAMVRRCDAAGVGIVVDAVINHMAAIGEGEGIAGTSYSEFRYGDLYSRDDFNHCDRYDDDHIRDYQSRYEVQYCHLLGLADLATGETHVRARIADYLQTLVDLGVAGFRIDAAKHMPAEDVAAIIDRLDGEPYIFQEVIDPGDEPITKWEYQGIAAVTEFNYPHEVATAIEEGAWDRLKHVGEGDAWLKSDSALVFVDNHDNQRGHVGGGVLMHRDAAYPLALAFKLAWPYGTPKLMSSFAFEDGDQGPPSDPDAGWATTPVHGDDGIGCLDPDDDPNEGWVCEHRWSEVTAMVGFRKAAGDAPVTHWQQDGATRIAFSRDDAGFLAINGGDDEWDARLQTGLPEGAYCNVLAADCDTPVHVGGDGVAEVAVRGMDAVALQVNRTAE
ncbi:alpha-amylase [Aquisalimonas asiatica]|uniref:Alpha-amylase n=1 Tax=Aquisalimonas asiatica TaxID=406100 RepID=A0A1H8RJL1_9GAMM|nr:alpha-amylase family protein [Aquisalimonas asiatica]SEO66546.1 alpha-amylase [Aquisalimonas asiatica]